MSKQVGIHPAVVTIAAGAAFVLSWSSGFLIPAMVSAEDNPVAVLAWRFIPVAALLLALVGVTGAGRGIRPRELGMQVAIGALAQFGYCLAVYAAVASGIATGTVALIDAVQPLVVAVLVGPLLGLRVRSAQWAGLVVGALGVLLVVRSQFGGSTATPLAYLLPAVAMACLVAATFLQRRSPTRTGVLPTLTIHVTTSAVLLVVVGAVTGTLAPPAEPGFWLAVALTALLPTLAGYGLYWWLLRRIGITALQALLFLVAPTTALVGGLVLGETLTVTTLLGFLLCAAGVAAVLGSEARERRRAPASRRDAVAVDRAVRGEPAPCGPRT